MDMLPQKKAGAWERAVNLAAARATRILVHTSLQLLSQLVLLSFPMPPLFAAPTDHLRGEIIMKKQLIAAFACTAALSLYGCSSQPQATETPASVSLQSEAATETPVDTSADSSEAESADGTSIDGVIIDASMNSMTIQSADAGIVSFDISEVADKDLADGLLIGNVITVTYEGDIDAAQVTRLADSDAVPALATDRLQMAADIITAVNSGSIELLASLTNYPVYVDLDGGMTVETADEFKALGADALFTDALVEAVTTVDLLSLEEVEAGVVLGDDAGNNIIFRENEDGNLGVAGINFAE